jgi:hypothetical protein
MAATERALGVAAELWVASARGARTRCRRCRTTSRFTASWHVRADERDWIDRAETQGSRGFERRAGSFSSGRSLPMTLGTRPATDEDDSIMTAHANARGSLLRTSQRRGAMIVALLGLVLGGADVATADVRAIGDGPRLPRIAQDQSEHGSRPFATCTDQTYALCATAECFVFNGIAYCRCDVEHGDSISLPFPYAPGKNVCTANAEGVGNGYMISTYSFPESALAPQGDMALYTCPASTSNAAYAQCDGGYCFESTRGQTFPGFAEPLADDEIVCSCPITVANPETAMIGFQIAGPWPCQQEFFANCDSPPAGKNTGDTIYVGAPTGTATVLTRLLEGQVPPHHRCTLETE